MDKRFGALLGMTLVCSVASAQMYKWKDANGQVHFTQLPPKAGTTYEQIGPAPPPAASPNQDALNQSLTDAQRNAPKQQEAAAKAEQQQAQRQENCRKALERIAYLESRGPRRLGTTDDKGASSRMTEEEYNRRLGLERDLVSKNCD